MRSWNSMANSCQYTHFVFPLSTRVLNVRIPPFSTTWYSRARPWPRETAHYQANRVTQATKRTCPLEDFKRGFLSTPGNKGNEFTGLILRLLNCSEWMKSALGQQNRTAPTHAVLGTSAHLKNMLGRRDGELQTTKGLGTIQNWNNRTYLENVVPLRWLRRTDVSNKHLTWLPSRPNCPATVCWPGLDGPAF